MSGQNRRLHETATVLNQQFLDYSQDNLEQKLQLIAEIECNQLFERRSQVSITLDDPALISGFDHRITEGQQIIFETTGLLPSSILPGNIYYARNVTADDFNISSTPAGSLISTLGESESGNHYVSSASGLIRISDRNIFVGQRFYEARTNFPTIVRTLGEWLRPEIEFGSIQISINNVDGFFNSLNPSGEYYSNFINKNINIKLGLRDVESTYFSIFNGYVSDTGGFKRTTKTIELVARDKFDQLNKNFPASKFSDSVYPKISSTVINNVIPIIYGNYREEIQSEGNIPAIIVNSGDPELFFDKELPITFILGSPGSVQLDNHNFDEGDIIKFETTGLLPSPLNTIDNFYVRNPTTNTFNISSTPAGSLLNLSGGSGTHNLKAQTLRNIQCVISANDLKSFDTTSIYLVRGEAYYLVSSSDIVNLGAGNKSFEVVQNSGNTLIDGEVYRFEDSDTFLVKVEGKDLGSYSSNIISQAMDLLETYGGLISSDFDSNWTTYKNKSLPIQSSISTIKSRIWIGEERNLLEYSLSLLEQVRLEFFISRDLKLKINSLHFEDFESNPSHRVRNFDVEMNSISISIDETNNFNRARGFFDFSPIVNENIKKTTISKNQNSIDQIGKEISKKIEFPNLYIFSDVKNQVNEILKLASGYYEIINVNLTTRALLLDLGDFVKMDVKIGSTLFNDVPMMIREIGYNPDMKLEMKLWSMQMIPFGNPAGWNPSYNGVVGGDTASIIDE